MSSDQFLQFADAFAEPLLLLAADGAIVAANQAMEERLAVRRQELHGRTLLEWTQEPAESIRAYLRLASRTRRPALGAITLRRPDGTVIPCRVEGSVLQPRSGEEPALLLLRFTPRAETPSQFAILTQRVNELTREIARRQQAEEELRAHREWLRVTLTSIGDAVIATDEKGRITFINAVAQALTGRHEAEALGRPLDQVFRILNEETRAPAQHPVARVLQAGHVVGLANHTLLLAADGTEYPIDDSAAPIQDESGAMIGVVLVFREVTERRRMERELRDRAEALTAAGRRRDEFLAMLAHELRNPLAPIRNAVELLKLAGPPEPRLARGREIIERQVNHLARMIDELLDVSRITQGKINVRLQPLDLTRLVQDTVGDSQPALQQAGVSLSVEIPATPVWVAGDPTRLAQVVGNLLNNAVKFTDPGGAVTVRLAIENDDERARDRAPEERAVDAGGRRWAVLTVSDSGIGIDPRALDELFEPFAQADRSLERSRGGLGLGLALVKGLAELHGGQVRAWSAGLGQGAEFTVRLPLLPAAAALEAAPSRLGSAAAVRVLIIEDNRDAADSMRELLDLAGCRTEVAYSGQEGVAAARRFRPQVVLCDLGLPGMDGYRVAAELRRDPRTASARLIAISGYSDAADRHRSQTAGFDAHLAKPVALADLQPLLQPPPERGR